MIAIPLLPQQAACACGSCSFQVKTKPFARFICHCRICQAYTGRFFSDITVLRARDVFVPNMEKIQFRKYRLPPNISRGSCSECGKPVLEFGGVTPAKLAFVPAGNYLRPETLPEPAMHTFYHRRVNDTADNLPKYSGYFISQMHVVSLLTRGFISG